MKNRATQNLLDKVHRPILFLSILGFVIMGITTFFIINSLIESSIKRQANVTIGLFGDSIREDLLNGLENEVYRKCISGLKNTLLSQIKVVGLGNRIICDNKKEYSGKSFDLKKKIYFNPKFNDLAGHIYMRFELSLGRKILLRILPIIIATIFLLLIGYWFISQYLIKKETSKFTKLAQLLSESNIDVLENCVSEFPNNQTKEIEALCFGIEELSKNWRNYLNSHIKNERLKAINISTRLIAHDMKSPIGALKSVQLNLDKKPQLAKDLLERGIVRLEKMLLDIVINDEQSRPTSKKLIVDLKCFATELENDLKMHYDHLESIELQFDVRIDNFTHQTLLDRQLILRAIENLIKNSIEAIGSQVGTIKVLIVKNINEFFISIEDTGPGLSACIIDQINFGKVVSTKTGGNGLGFMQVKYAIESHGGNLEIESIPNVGTRVTLRFNS